MPDNEEERQPDSDSQVSAGDGDYAQLLDDYSHFAPPSEGELLKGHVLKVTNKEVIVDFGYKSEGLVPIEQFQYPDGSVRVKSGDAVDVMVDKSGNRVEGYVLLSYERAHQARIWDDLDQAQKTNQTLTGRVIEKTKGGLTVDIGIPAFMPGSQIAVRPVYNLDQFVGKDIPVKVVKINKRRGNVVVSRRLAIEEEEGTRKSEALGELQEGSVVQGIVKNLTDYGVFVDLGGIDGLLHVSDMSYGRITHPSEMLHAGDEVTVKVLKFDKEKERISLGIKQLASNPRENIDERYAIGNRVIGRVVSVTDYGAFVELEPGVEGLIHISEMTWSRRMKHPAKVVKAGDQVEAVVLDIKPKERRVSLGIKQLEADPWTTVADRYSIGSVIEGRVRKLTEFGCFIEIEEGIDGLVHISDLSWTKRITHPSEILKKGQLVQAVVLHIDAENRRLSLGVKQLQPDAWETFFRTHIVGDTVRGKICRASNFGVFVELSPGVEGLCHNSEIPNSGAKKGEPPLPIGEELDFKILKMNEADKKIGLSARAVSEYDERSAADERHTEDATTSADAEEANNVHARED
jgi:small subunit ribosomal protein S1